MPTDLYPLAKDGVFRTVQGEGALLGAPMTFVRLAGCSVGCSGCDTDYRASERVTAAEIRRRVLKLGLCEWTWITGGEPADHDLWPLLEELRKCGRVALATSGSKPLNGADGLVDFLSVSPHGWGGRWVVRNGNQINVVPGLNGLRLDDMPFDAYERFTHRYITPLWGGKNFQQALDFVNSHRGQGWRLGIQAHRYWGSP